jgi:hypothetical protein
VHRAPGEQHDHHRRDPEPDQVEHGEVEVDEVEVEPEAERERGVERDQHDPHLGRPDPPVAEREAAERVALQVHVDRQDQVGDDDQGGDRQLDDEQPARHPQPPSGVVRELVGGADPERRGDPDDRQVVGQYRARRAIRINVGRSQRASRKLGSRSASTADG